MPVESGTNCGYASTSVTRSNMFCAEWRTRRMVRNEGMGNSRRDLREDAGSKAEEIGRDMSGRPPTRRTTTRKVRFGARDFLARGLERNFWGDLYHTSLTISWLQFFAFAALAFLTINTVYAALYFLGHEPIANARPGSFRDLFYFSIETLATVGYGDMHPQTDYAHLLATIEIFTGLSFLSIMTGLVFTRFSRPRARV